MWVKKIGFENNENDEEGKVKVYINEKQYFDNVPAVAWNFYIGGYQTGVKMAQRPQKNGLLKILDEYYILSKNHCGAFRKRID